MYILVIGKRRYFTSSMGFRGPLVVAPHPVEEVLLGGHLCPVLQVPQLVTLAHQLVSHLLACLK